MRENENTPDEYAFSMFGYNILNDFEDDSHETGMKFPVLWSGLGCLYC